MLQQKRDYTAGIALGESYLQNKPQDANVLEQTAVLTLASARRDYKNREVLVKRAVVLLERSLKNSQSDKNPTEIFLNRFRAAHTFEFAGDLSSQKCVYYKRASELYREAPMTLNTDNVQLRDGKEISSRSLREQTAEMQSQLDKKIVEVKCR